MATKRGRASGGATSCLLSAVRGVLDEAGTMGDDEPCCEWGDDGSSFSVLLPLQFLNRVNELGGTKLGKFESLRRTLKAFGFVYRKSVRNCPELEAQWMFSHQPSDGGPLFRRDCPSDDREIRRTPPKRGGAAGGAGGRARGGLRLHSAAGGSDASCDSESGGSRSPQADVEPYLRRIRELEREVIELQKENESLVVENERLSSEAAHERKRRRPSESFGPERQAASARNGITAVMSDMMRDIGAPTVIDGPSGVPAGSSPVGSPGIGGLDSTALVTSLQERNVHFDRGPPTLPISVDRSSTTAPPSTSPPWATPHVRVATSSVAVPGSSHPIHLDLEIPSTVEIESTEHELSAGSSAEWDDNMLESLDDISSSSADDTSSEDDFDATLEEIATAELGSGSRLSSSMSPMGGSPQQLSSSQFALIDPWNLDDAVGDSVVASEHEAVVPDTSRPAQPEVSRADRASLRAMASTTTIARDVADHAGLGLSSDDFGQRAPLVQPPHGGNAVEHQIGDRAVSLRMASDDDNPLDVMSQAGTTGPGGSLQFSTDQFVEPTSVGAVSRQTRFTSVEGGSGVPQEQPPDGGSTIQRQSRYVPGTSMRFASDADNPHGMQSREGPVPRSGLLHNGRMETPFEEPRMGEQLDVSMRGADVVTDPDDGTGVAVTDGTTSLRTTTMPGEAAGVVELDDGGAFARGYVDEGSGDSQLLSDAASGAWEGFQFGGAHGSYRNGVRVVAGGSSVQDSLRDLPAGGSFVGEAHTDDMSGPQSLRGEMASQLGHHSTDTAVSAPPTQGARALSGIGDARSLPSSAIEHRSITPHGFRSAAPTGSAALHGQPRPSEPSQRGLSVIQDDSEDSSPMGSAVEPLQRFEAVMTSDVADGRSSGLGSELRQEINGRGAATGSTTSSADRTIPDDIGGEAASWPALSHVDGQGVHRTLDATGDAGTSSGAQLGSRTDRRRVVSTQVHHAGAGTFAAAQGHRSSASMLPLAVATVLQALQSALPRQVAARFPPSGQAVAFGGAGGQQAHSSTSQVSMRAPPAVLASQTTGGGRHQLVGSHGHTGGHAAQVLHVSGGDSHGGGGSAAIVHRSQVPQVAQRMRSLLQTDASVATLLEQLNRWAQLPTDSQSTTRRAGGSANVVPPATLFTLEQIKRAFGVHLAQSTRRHGNTLLLPDGPLSGQAVPRGGADRTSNLASGDIRGLLRLGSALQNAVLCATGACAPVRASIREDADAVDSSDQLPAELPLAHLLIAVALLVAHGIPLRVRVRDGRLHDEVSECSAESAMQSLPALSGDRAVAGAASDWAARARARCDAMAAVMEAGDYDVHDPFESDPSFASFVAGNSFPAIHRATEAGWGLASRHRVTVAPAC